MIGKHKKKVILLMKNFLLLKVVYHQKIHLNLIKIYNGKDLHNFYNQVRLNCLM